MWYSTKVKIMGDRSIEYRLIHEISITVLFALKSLDCMLRRIAIECTEQS